MNVELGKEWLRASYSDILVMEEIIDNDFLTHMIAFHAQQSIEKSLKALIETSEETVPKSHDLILLKERAGSLECLENEEFLEELNQLYIDSRYPATFGLLPNGKPTLKDAEEFYRFAQKVFKEVCDLLKIEINELR